MLGITLLMAIQFVPNAETCADWGNLPQQHMNACAAWDFEQADAELNAVWEEVLEYARTHLSDSLLDVDERPPGDERLIVAQRAWITLRDEHCAVWGYHMRGGSAEPMLYNGCRADMTRDRIEALRALMLEDQ
jgi:uncharacterized protein YecT (DUF1311 family)